MNAPVPDPSLVEQGRRLASQREDLIAQGACPREVLIPLHPGTPRPRLAEVEARLADARFAPLSTETKHLDPNTVPIPYAPAVRRGIEAVGRLPGATYLNSTRATVHALCAALVVEEIALTLGEHEAQMRLPDGVAPDDYDGRDHWMCSCDHDYGVYDVGADPDPAIRAHEAQVLVAAILGTDQ